MASTTQTNFDPALKQIYRDSNVQKLTYTNRPLFGMLPKFEGFGGRNMPIVLQYGNPQGRSATFATAQSNATQVYVQDFVLTRVNNYAVSTIDGEVIESTRGDSYAFLSALKLKLDSTMATLADDIESNLFRTSDGYLAQIASVTAANPAVITLSQTEEITAFEVGMVLVASPNADGSATETNPATATVDAINRSAGTITTNDDASGSTDWDANDYLFVQGDIGNKISGLLDWLPATVPTTAFFGVDRSVDSRMGGVYHDGSSDTLEDAAIDAQSKVSREGGSPDVLILHHAQVRRLIKELGGKKEYSESFAASAKGMLGNIGYRSLVLQGDHGPVGVVAANKCQATKGWLLQKSTWTLATLGAPVKFLMEDGNRILRQAAADGYEVRMGFRGQLGCKAPIWNAHINLPNP